MWVNPEKLKKKSEPHAHLAAMGPDLYTLHRADGFAVHVERNAERVLGLHADELVGKGFLANVHILDRIIVAKAIEECLAIGGSRKAQFRLSSTGPGKTVAPKWYELRCQPAPEAAVDGESVLVIAVSRDISERRALEEELHRQREMAESASVAKSRFLANMSHELRTPLNAILGFSEVLLSEHMRNMPPERTKEYISLIHSSSGHLLNVLNDILDMSKIESGKYEIITEPFNLAGAVKASCQIMRGQAERKNIELTLGDMTELPEVAADERAIKQIVINLVSNAVKFTEEGGRVEVTAKRSGRHIKLVVSDNGIGISPEHINKLGTPFYQADSKYDKKYEGTGLGLSVVRGLVDLHHGSVRFSSHKGKGTTVTVSIPIVPPDAKPIPAHEHLELVQLDRLRTA